MAYEKTVWVEGGPPGISAEKLSKIEMGIKDAHDAQTAHLADIMPHKFEDNGVTYRWGFRTVNGSPQFIYEEVV
ncbi:MAG: hypothetical protein SCK28_04560 [Bacillota bacterium]|nr:hypothetical protein [Bacillota bacterium]